MCFYDFYSCHEVLDYNKTKKKASFNFMTFSIYAGARGASGMMLGNGIPSVYPAHNQI